MGNGAGNEERPVLPDLDFDIGVEDQFPLLVSAPDILRKGAGRQATGPNVSEKWKRDRAAIIDHNLQRIGWFPEDQDTHHVARVEEIPVGAGEVRGEQSDDERKSSQPKATAINPTVRSMEAPVFAPERN
ncbi:hypothetical protein N183_30910 [Sinorhizobium sp. Sb3]|nr:hypothetical protein N183_30910 [Sinorhizobium sp. Sb3]